MALVRVVDDRNALLADRIADAVDPGNEDEPAGKALSPNGHCLPPSLRRRSCIDIIERTENILPCG